eukprot:5234333-Prymnesium_polylepis.1
MFSGTPDWSVSAAERGEAPPCPTPPRGPLSEFSRLPGAIPVRGDRTDVYAVHTIFPGKDRG